jgi:hypothetical protein
MKAPENPSLLWSRLEEGHAPIALGPPLLSPLCMNWGSCLRDAQNAVLMSAGDRPVMPQGPGPCTMSPAPLSSIALKVLGKYIHI